MRRLVIAMLAVLIMSPAVVAADDRVHPIGPPVEGFGERPSRPTGTIHGFAAAPTLPPTDTLD